MKTTFSELYELFYVAAYGCNRRCEEEIRKVFFSHKKDTPFLFFEFFLTQPLPKDWPEDRLKDVYVVAPFAPRMAEHSVVVPIQNDDKSELVFRNCDALKGIQLIFRLDKSRLALHTWEHWSSRRLKPPPGKAALAAPIEPDMAETPVLVDDRSTAARYWVRFVDQWTMRWQCHSYLSVSEAEPLTNLNARLLCDLLKPLFVDNLDTQVSGLFVPIASSRLYYGGIWALMPGLKSDTEECFRKQIGLQLSQLAERTYLPVLTVLYEHWLERLHKEYLDEDKDHKPKLAAEQFEVEVGEQLKARYNGNLPKAVFQNVFFSLAKSPPESTPHRHTGTEAADEIETLMINLWHRRETTDSWRARNVFEESLIFEHYLICSECMAQLVSRVIVAAKTLRKTGKTLPGCLVVGGAGSGKEDLARMLRLFSVDPDPVDKKQKGYYEGKEYVVNLASIRPAPLTAAVVTGLELKGSHEIRFPGILYRLREETSTNKTGPPTLRLDEFNSMDPDSQGVLLRFLDNSEIVALGCLEDAKDPDHKLTNCLVVGIMNEDPEDISREKAMEFFRNGEYLGKFMGDLLYEHFFRLRRLRPDVMYRMIRNGKFVIPALSQRRQDIPLLFRVYINKELKAIRAGKSKEQWRLHISLDVLDRLVRDDLSWPGNVRQLQALTKIVAERLWCEQQGGDWYVVTLPVLDMALREVGLLAESV